MIPNGEKQNSLYCCDCGEAVEAESGNCPNCGSDQLTLDANLAVQRLRQSWIDKEKRSQDFSPRKCILAGAVVGVMAGPVVGLLWPGPNLDQLVLLDEACRLQENAIRSVVIDHALGASFLAGAAAGALGAFIGTLASSDSSRS